MKEMRQVCRSPRCLSRPLRFGVTAFHEGQENKQDDIKGHKGHGFHDMKGSRGLGAYDTHSSGTPEPP